VNSEVEAKENKQKGLRPTYLPRLMLAGMIVILLMILIPVLRERKPAVNRLAFVEPPLAMKYYSTGYATTDSLLNSALRDFGQKNYNEAAHLLSKVYFYWSVQVREGRIRAYPEDLRFYLGLSEFYRGHPELAAPYLESEEKASPFDERFPWYLAHVYIAEGDLAKAREELEQVVKIGEKHASEAQEKMRLLPAAADSSSSTPR
jgi:tetratricopeptide (TPR) repeat protein